MQTSPNNNQCHQDVGIVVSTALYIGLSSIHGNLFQAIKTNENHHQLSELISSVHFHLKTIDQQDREMINYDAFKIMDKDFNYWKIRDTITHFELILLRILDFDLVLDLPHKYLIFYLKFLSNWIDKDFVVDRVFQLSWSILNDFLCYYPKSPPFESNQIALATLEIAMITIDPDLKKICSNKTSSHRDWYTNFDERLDSDSIENIICEIFKFYR
ncbi:hypothetical protein NH340_JMT00811 [Sarcoptes scabiei]|nr:hypothetical protein NH340_JMT00811 [Sarcoptes scabiei]